MMGTAQRLTGNEAPGRQGRQERRAETWEIQGNAQEGQGPGGQRGGTPRARQSRPRAAGGRARPPGPDGSHAHLPPPASGAEPGWATRSARPAVPGRGSHRDGAKPKAAVSRGRGGLGPGAGPRAGEAQRGSVLRLRVTCMSAWPWSVALLWVCGGRAGGRTDPLSSETPGLESSSGQFALPA